MAPAVLFDLDGTLADTVPVIAHHIAVTITSFGTLVLPEAVVPYIGQPLEVALIELSGLSADDPQIAEMVDAYKESWRGAVDEHGVTLLLPGARALLHTIRSAGYRIGVVTAKTTQSARHLLAAIGIEDLVDVVVGTDRVANGKPAPDSALLAAEELGIDPATTWYVGDAVTDVVMARAAGMRPLGVTTGASSEEALLTAGAERVVADASAVAPVVLGG